MELWRLGAVLDAAADCPRAAAAATASSLRSLRADSEAQEWLSPPVVNASLQRRMQHMAAEYCGPLPPSALAAVQFHLEQALGVSGSEGPALLALGELASAAMDAGRPRAAKAVFTTMLHALRSGPGVSALLQAGTLAVRSVAMRHPQTLVPLAVDNLMQAAALTEGGLLAFRAATEHLDPESYVELVPTELAIQIAEKCLACMNSVVPSSDRAGVRAQQLSLEVLGDVARCAGEEAMGRCVRAVVALLGQQPDRRTLANCELQLHKIFAVLPVDHPLVSSLSSEVAASLQSPQWQQRQTAVTLYAIFGTTLKVAQTRSFCVRLLADPHERVRERLLFTLLNSTQGSLKELAHIVQPTIEQMVTKTMNDTQQQQQQQQQRRPGLGPEDGDGQDDDDRPGSGRYKVPLPDRDPLNRLYMKSPAYKQLLQRYGLDKAGEHEGEGRGGEDQTRPRRGSVAGARRGSVAGARRGSVAGARRGSVARRGSTAVQPGQAEEEAEGEDRVGARVQSLLGLDLIPLMKEMLMHDETRGQQLLNGMKKDLAHAQELVEGDDLSVYQSKMGELGHNIEVYMNVLRACEGLRGDIHDFLVLVQNFLTACEQRCGLLRSAVIQGSKAISFLKPEAVELPVATEEEYQKASGHRLVVEAAARSGKKRGELALSRRSAQRDTAAQTTALWQLTQLQSKLHVALTAVYAGVKTMQPSHLCTGFDWMMASLDNCRHRGVRLQLRQTLLRVVRAHRSAQFFVDHAAETFVRLELLLRPRVLPMLPQQYLVQQQQQQQQQQHGRRGQQPPGGGGAAGAAVSHAKAGEASEPEPKRWPPRIANKADSLWIMAHLLKHSPDKHARVRALHILMYYWDDPDGQVRRTSIQLLLLLGRDGVPEMSQLMGTAKTSLGASRKGTVNRSSLLMAAITQRMKEPAYQDKEELNKLLMWYFEQQGASPSVSGSRPA